MLHVVDGYGMCVILHVLSMHVLTTDLICRPVDDSN